MIRNIICVLILVFGIEQLSAQKKAGLFGRKVYIGWEHSIRPFGNSSLILSNQGIGIGKIKLEKLINKNRTIGISYEKKGFLINDVKARRDYVYTPQLTSAIPQRYLTMQTYSIFIKKFYRSNGIAPMGKYISATFSFNKNSIDYKRNGDKRMDFADVYLSFEIGRSFPLVGQRLMLNISAGVHLSGSICAQELLLGGIIDDYYSGIRELTPNEMNLSLFGMNVIKANIGLSYAVF